MSDPPVELSLSEEAPLGFSAEDLLNVSSGGSLPASFPAHSSEVMGADPVPGEWTWSLEPASDRARFVRRVWELGGDGADERCSDFLSLDVRLNLRLENEQGSWSHSIITTLSASSASLATLTASLSVTDSLDTFQVNVEESDETPKSVDVELLFSPYGSAGSLRLVTESLFVPEGYDPDAEPSSDAPQARPYMREHYYPLAYFPRGSSCGAWNDDSGSWRYAPLIELDLAGGSDTSPLDEATFLDLLTRQGTITWEDGRSSTLSSGASLGESLACLSPRCGYYCSFADDLADLPHVLIPTDLSLTTEDGRLDGEYAVQAAVTLEGAASQMRSVTVRLEERGVSAAEVEARTGLVDIPMVEGDTALLLLETSFGVAEKDWSGRLLLNSFSPGAHAGELVRKGTW